MALKKRYWMAIIYPNDSAPDDWLDILKETHVPMAISPLHDKDVNPDGEPKKAHRHILIAYDGPTTFKNVVSMLTPLGGPIPVPCESVRGAFRYLTHQDNPEKFRYDDREVICINGFSQADYAGLTATEVTEIIKRLERIARENKFCRINELADYLNDNDMLEEHDVLINHTYFLRCYLDGQYHTRIEEREKQFEKMGVLMDGINESKIYATIGSEGKKKK